MNNMIPFFVVDRPISLKIIQGLKIPRGQKIGLMAHAKTTPNFRRAFREYPGRQVIKMCDSAIFNLGGYKKGYGELFDLYEEMRTDYGVMIDVFRSSKATLESAKKALATYNPNRHHFKLVAVAQGKTAKQYLDCYKQLRQMGFRYIAIGGLLHKREKTARYTNVRSEALLSEVLQRVRQEFDPEWLFALGCLHPSRLELFKQLDVWGDYKGWIFEYRKRDESMEEVVQQLSDNHLRHVSQQFRGSVLDVELRKLLAKRREALRARSEKHTQLLASKNALKDFIIELSQRLRKKYARIARTLEPLKSRGLLEVTRGGQLLIALQKAGVSKQRRGKLVLLAEGSRRQKLQLQIAERRAERCNRELLGVLLRLQRNRFVNSNLKRNTAKLIRILKSSEQIHRIRQVRDYIEKRILAEL